MLGFPDASASSAQRILPRPRICSTPPAPSAPNTFLDPEPPPSSSSRPRHRARQSRRRRRRRQKHAHSLALFLLSIFSSFINMASTNGSPSADDMGGATRHHELPVPDDQIIEQQQDHTLCDQASPSASSISTAASTESSPSIASVAQDSPSFTDQVHCSTSSTSLSDFPFSSISHSGLDDPIDKDKYMSSIHANDVPSSPQDVSIAATVLHALVLICSTSHLLVTSLELESILPLSLLHFLPLH